jgi:endonuclease YncB( thermonuclease family)
MKKVTLSLLLFLSIVVLSGCSGKLRLPDIENMTYGEANTVLRDKGISFYKIEVETDNEALIGLVDGYNLYKENDRIQEDELIGILIYVLGTKDAVYFEPINIEYEGPYLDEDYSDINYIDPRGGYFEVTLKNCTDGDTGRFHYPQDIYDVISNSAKSVRFLNMDTEETFTGGVEEWGKPASNYTCSLLTSAESIIIQTDPGDAIIGTYGRLLGWIWVQLPNQSEYQLLNYMVVQQGLAQVKYEFGAGTSLIYGERTYNEWMHYAMDYAEENRLGQWGAQLDSYWDYDNNQPK